MERLTKRTYTISEPHVEMVAAVAGVNVTNILERLAAYEDAEEAGLLVRLPCKVGDTVFVESQGMILNGVVENVSIYGGKAHIFAKHNTVTWAFDANNFGVSVFPTREEAKAALAKEG